MSKALFNNSKLNNNYLHHSVYEATVSLNPLTYNVAYETR